MKVRDLLDKFLMTEDDEIIIRIGFRLDKYKAKVNNYATFDYEDTIPNEILDKEVINFFLGRELDSNILFITIEETL